MRKGEEVMSYKISELPVFDASDSIKNIQDAKDWMEVSIQEDNTIDELKNSLLVILKAIDKINQ